MVVVGEDVGRGLDGIREKEPVFGLPALWVSKDRREEVRELGLTSVDSLSVLVTHLSQIVMHHASELISWEEVSRLVDGLKQTSPRLVEETMGDVLTISKLHRIVKLLLAEQVSIIDIETIVETASDHASGSIDTCVEKVRIALRRQICSQVSSPNVHGQQSIQCITLPPAIESALHRNSYSDLQPKTLTAALLHAAAPIINEGRPPVVVVSSDATRRVVRDAVAKFDPTIVVLSQQEIVTEVDLEIVGTIDVASRAS
jgi:flagellar biosynthesis protein FlhA